MTGTRKSSGKNSSIHGGCDGQAVGSVLFTRVLVYLNYNSVFFLLTVFSYPSTRHLPPCTSTDPRITLTVPPLPFYDPALFRIHGFRTIFQIFPAAKCNLEENKFIFKFEKSKSKIRHFLSFPKNIPSQIS